MLTLAPMSLPSHACSPRRTSLSFVIGRNGTYSLKIKRTVGILHAPLNPICLLRQSCTKSDKGGANDVNRANWPPNKDG